MELKPTPRARPKVLSLTDAAADRVRLVMADKPDVAGLKIGVKKGGCAGMEYVMDYAEAPEPFDELVEDRDVRILVKADAVMFLLGSEIDHETTRLASRFVFKNPNQTDACGCGDYANRKKRVPDCVKLTPKNVPKLDWLPPTCAYRLVSEGRDLYWWHPLVSGDAETVHASRASVRGKTRPEGRLKIPGLLKRIVKWPEPAEAPPAASKRAVGKRRP